MVNIQSEILTEFKKRSSLMLNILALWIDELIGIEDLITCLALISASTISIYTPLDTNRHDESHGLHR